MAFIWAEWTGIRLVGESTRELRCFAGASAGGGAKRRAKFPVLAVEMRLELIGLASTREIFNTRFATRTWHRATGQIPLSMF